MSDPRVNPPGHATWGSPPPASSPPSPPSPVASGPPVYGTPARANDLVAPRTSGAAIFGGFVATAACAILAFLQVMSGLLGLAYDSPLPDPNEAEIRNGKIFVALFATSVVAGAMVVLALALTIAATANRERRVLRWIFVPLVVNLVLCVATWGFGLASIPS